MLQIRAVSLKSYLDVASFVGIDGKQLLADAKVPAVALDNEETRLPAAAVVQLLESSARASDCDSFGIRMARCRSFASLGPVSLLLQHLQDIRHVMDELGRFRSRLSDTLLTAIEEGPESVSLTFDVVPPYNEQQAVGLTVGLAYLTLSGASQGRWSPDVVHFTHDRPVDQLEFANYFNADIEYNSGFNGFSCTPLSLRTPLPLSDSGMAANARFLLQRTTPPAITAPYSDHIRRAIVLMLAAGRAGIKDLAVTLGEPVRIMQQNLKSEETTFENILNEVRRDLARRYLHTSGLNLTHVAHALGYSSLSSFTRWFKSEFDQPPSEWRRAQREWAGRPSGD